MLAVRPSGARPDKPRFVLLSLLLAACGDSAAVRAPAETAAPVGDRVPVARLADVACDGATCRALADGNLLALPDRTPIGAPGAFAGADTLRVGPGGWEVEGPCPAEVSGDRCVRVLGADGAPGTPTPVRAAAPTVGDPLPLSEAAEAFTAAWNHGLAREWRSGFYPVVVGPGGGRITWLRGLEGAGQLVRAGAGSRTVRLGAASSSVSWPAWLAVHPTGVEAYLVAWPAPVVRAFDPATLEVRWTLPVDGAAQGLFVDPGGRWLVVATGPGTTERFVDWPVPRPELGERDPHRDEVLRTLDRPPMDEVLVIDLALHEVVGRARGTYRRFLPLQRPVLATDREVVFLTPGELPS